MNQGTKTTYLNQGGGQNCPTPLKTLKMHIFQWNLPKMKYSTWSFEISQKKLFSLSMTSLWRHYDVIIMQFSMYIGQKLKMLYLWNIWSYKTRSYIVGKHLTSSKRWFIIGMDISVPNREISVLNSTKIPEKSEKSEFFVGGPKI